MAEFRIHEEHRKSPGKLSDEAGARVAEGTEGDQINSLFADLVARWRKETRHLSVMSKMVLNPCYLRIIGLGERAVPLLLRELEVRPNYWFTALSAITGENPAASASNFDEARVLWLKWGHTRYNF